MTTSTSGHILKMAAEVNSPSDNPIHVTEEIGLHAFADIRRGMLLDWCKWDPQVGDVSTLARFALAVSRTTWRQLAEWSERLAAESLAAEAELLDRPDLHRRLGLPGRIRRALRRHRKEGPTQSAARTIRFDFHWTTDGWRISEANADVPGGFSEASSFAALVAEALPNARYRVAGDPGGAFADAMAAACKESDGSNAIALLSAAGFMEDHQVVSYMARRCAERGLRTWLASPEQLEWGGGHARLNVGEGAMRLGAIVRFYQGEWLGKLPRQYGRHWEHLFAGGRTPVANPGSAVLIESKRFPLVWADLSRATMPTWRALLPETREARHANWLEDDRWLLKSAFCNTGDTVSIASRMTPRDRLSVGRAARWHPNSWIAQRIFQTVAINTPLGEMFPCVGVHTIDGRATGAYARLSPGPVIDYAAIDVALLIDDDVDLVEKERP